MNLLDKLSNQPSKLRLKIWVEINDDARQMYNTNSQIKFETSILKSNLCDYSDAYILVKVTIIIAPAPARAANRNNNNKELIFKNNCLKLLFKNNSAPFTDCISEINNTQLDNAKDIDTVMPMYNLIEYSNN